MIELLLDPDLPNERLLDFTATQALLLNFLDSNLDAGGLMPRQLDLSVGSFSKICLFGLNELKVILLDIGEELLQALLLRGQAAFVIRLLDEGSGCLDPLHVAEEDRVSCLRHLARAFELMDFEPILLEASLRAIFDLLTLAFRTAVKWDELLLELPAVPLHKSSSLILLCRLLQRAHFIFALANMDNLVIWWLWNLGARRSRVAV